MLSFREYLAEATKGVTYSDEHAHANIWNHMVNKGIAHDKNAMHAELEKSKTDKTHPLHFDNAKHEGFTGGVKKKEAEASYHAENETAMHTIHALANHPDFKNAVKEKHTATVQGAARGELSDTWKKHGAKNATSKSDVSIHDKTGKSEGLKLSLKKGGGSQLMSAGPEESKAVHDVAAREMLNTHPKYKNLSQSKKNEIHSKVMSQLDIVGSHLNAMKTADESEKEKHKNAGQAASDAMHKALPELNHFVRKEATTGKGKFVAGSPAAASYIVKSKAGKNEASVEHVDKADHNGPLPRISKPKDPGRSGNIKADYK